MTTFGDRLRASRIAAGFGTAREAWERFGWNANSYRVHESSNKEPGRKTAIKYAQAFGADLLWLYTGQGKLNGKQLKRQGHDC